MVGSRKDWDSVPAELAELRQVLAEDEAIQPEWLDHPPWYNWWPDHVWNGLLWTLDSGH